MDDNFFKDVKSSDDIYVALENYYSCGGRIYGADQEREEHEDQEYD